MDLCKCHLGVLERSSYGGQTRAASDPEGSSKGSSRTWLGGGKTLEWKCTYLTQREVMRTN